MASRQHGIAREQVQHDASPRGATPVASMEAWRGHDQATAPLRRDAEQPVYRQLQDLIRGHVESGTWKPGEMIPAEKALAQQFGVARMTVRQATEGLMREGLLVRVRG